VVYRASLEFRWSPLPASAPPRLVVTRRGVSRPGRARLGTAASAMVHVPDGVADARFDASGLEIEIPLPPPIGTKRLQRPADEPAAKALTRLRATIEKARKSKPHKKKISRQTDGREGRDGRDGRENESAGESPPAPVAMLREGASGDPVDSETSNVEAWKEGRVLVIDGVGTYRVRVNAPSAATVSVAGYPTVGAPLVAVAGGLRHCDEDDDLEYDWFRESEISSSNESKRVPGIPVGKGRSYVPQERDVGRLLTVTATPKPPDLDDAACGEPASFTTSRATVTARPRPAAVARMRASNFLKSQPDAFRTDATGGKKSVVRVMTYNALADAYSRAWFELFPYLSKESADPQTRLLLAMEDVRLASPDIVALQEIDRKWYGEFWVPQMRAAGYVACGSLAEKTGSTREGCATFAKKDSWRVVDATAVSLKVPGPVPEEAQTAAFVASQPHLREALDAISTVGLIATLEPVSRPDEVDERKPLVVANAHLFFHPGATHVRVLQTRWLLRHAQKQREAYHAVLREASTPRESESACEERESSQKRNTQIGLVVCGDFNSEPFDAAARFARDGVLSAGDEDWAVGSVFRWGGTSSRDAAAELLELEATDAAPAAAAAEPETGSRNSGGVPRIPTPEALERAHQKLARMASCWRVCAETERGARPGCALKMDASTSPDAVGLDPLYIAQMHARNGCTFKTCACVAAWTFRRDAGARPGVALRGTSKKPWPGADAYSSGEAATDEAGGRGGGEEVNGTIPEWAREDVRVPAAAAAFASGDDPLSQETVSVKKESPEDASGKVPETSNSGSAGSGDSDLAEAVSAAVAAVDAHQAGLRAVQNYARAVETLRMDDIDAANADPNRANGWVAAAIGPCGAHLRHPLRLESACGVPEWTNYVSGFRGALDYVWCDTSRSETSAAMRSVAYAPMPPLEAVTRQTALPNDEFPSDHLPMVADLTFVETG